MKNLFSFAFVGCFLFFISNATAAETTLGETLVRDLWKDMHDGNLAKIQKSMAPEFQSVHEDIARNGAQQLELIKGMNLDTYELSDFKTTQTDSLIIVTYRVTAEERIAGMDLPVRDTMRLSIWTKTPEGWKWAAHANLNPLQSAPSDEPMPAAEQPH